MRPRVTLGVPVYNGERYLPHTLDSVVAQDFDDLEILISDNGSDDATEQICRDLARSDRRVRYLRSPENRGGAWNFNNLIAHAQGEFFKFAAADDLLRPAFVRRCVEALDRAGPSCVMVCPQTQLIDADGRIFEDLHDDDLRIDEESPARRLQHLFRSDAAHLIYGLMRTAELHTTRGIRPVVGDDFVLLAEMACRGSFALVPEQLFLMRRHARQFSSQGQGQVAWYDPGRNARWAFPQTALNRELYAAVLSSPLAPREKAAAVGSVARHWTIPRKRAVASDVRHALGIPWPLR